MNNTIVALRGVPQTAIALKRITREHLLTTSFPGTWWPGWLYGKEAVVGKTEGGLGTLVAILEQQFGLFLGQDAGLRRVMKVEKALRQYLHTNPDAFFARSFQRDAEAVSARLGGWIVVQSQRIGLDFGQGR